jgi:GABA permease
MTPARAQSRTPLSRRHVLMISFGGIIGAGLFVSSSALIASVGPAVLVTYAICGLLVFLVMRMLAELALSARNIQVFTEFTRQPLGNWAAFLSGWLYAYFWLIVIGVETIAGAATLQRWIPLPIWLLGGCLLGALTVVNLCAVRTFGELEFWLASIKVAAIILFAATGLGYILFEHPDHSHAGPALLFQVGGFTPLGVGAVIRNIPAAMFATCGAEIAAIAAMDSDQPAENISRSTQATIVRILMFYLGSILIILMIVPWNEIAVGYSPFVAALDRIGVSGGADIMNAVIFTAIVSCLNSGIYVAARTLRGLGLRGDAPSAVTRSNSRGIPINAALTAAAVGYALALFSVFSYKTVFNLLLSASGAIMLFIYLLIALAQIVNRRLLLRAQAPLPAVTMWLYPWLSWGVVTTIVVVLLLMSLDRDSALQLMASSVAALLLLIAYVARARLRRPISGSPASLND